MNDAIKYLSLHWEAVAGVLIAVTTAIFGIIKFSQTKKEEFKKEFWQKRYENYERVLELASKIAVTENLEKTPEEIVEFRQYYWGKLSMIEDQQVYDAMIQFENKLKYLEGSESNDFSELKNASYDLARACRNSLKETWEPVILEDLKDPLV
ncbi:hypothetical protein [Kordia sp.]|uniref:hypothetical protein n=1 Tax=Kordia sp. TaxID=1965332 RepID=UPI003D2C855A